MDEELSHLRKARLPTLMRSLAVLTVLLLAPLWPPVAAQSEDPGYRWIRDLMSPQRSERKTAAASLIASEDPRWVAPIADALFFIPTPARSEAYSVLQELTGTDRGRRYLDWIEWVGAHGTTPPPGYRDFKLSMLARIDERYRQVFYSGAPLHIRFEEIVSGGVRLDGIPALERPPQIPADEASYLRPQDRVFGVGLNGDHRAYPVKVLSWHEMLNDVVGGEPVVLSYCTLCGSGILYSTRTPNGGSYSFGTSGLLYRSNKLMYDRETFSLWINLTGEAVVGRKAVSRSRLEMLPLTLTTWEEWRNQHPDTTAMMPDPTLAQRFGFQYQEGAADRARRGVSFPVWNKSDRLEDKEEVFTLVLDSVAKAWQLKRLRAREVLNDRVGETAVVLISDRRGGVRAFERGERELRAADGASGDDLFLDREGNRYRMTEAALVPVESEPAAAPLGRLPGHVAYWFGWFGMFPNTELWPD